MYTGPNIVVEGLVFGYDTGYPLVKNNLDSYKFNKGEPTTNKLNDNILGTGNGASLGEDSFGTYIQLADQTTSYSRLQVPNITVVSNEVYTWSFEIYLLETMTRSGNYTFDTNEYSDQFPSSNDASRVSATHNRPDTIYANQWTPISLTVTMGDNLTGAYSYDFFNFYYPGFQNQKVYYRNMQFETKGHKSPYAGQGKTRSVSGSLIDLTRTTDIDLSNVSFDNNAQMTFDGTDDSILLTPRVQYSTGSAWTAELIFEPTTTGSWNGIFGGHLNAGGYWMFHGGQNLTYYEGSSAESGTRISYKSWSIGNTFTLNQDHHLTITYTPTTAGSGSFALYYNGGEKVDTFDYGFYWAHSLDMKKIGSGDSNRYGTNNIKIFKFHNIALTAEEVKQNYNAIKDRFNI